MKMEHGLICIRSAVYDQTVTFISNALFNRQIPAGDKHVTDQIFMILP